MKRNSLKNVKIMTESITGSQASSNASDKKNMKKKIMQIFVKDYYQHGICDADAIQTAIEAAAWYKNSIEFKMSDVLLFS